MATDNLEKEQKEFVILRRYRDLPEAVVAKSILDFDGIECFLTDENLIRMDWFWSGLLGGVKLWVRQQDIDEAQNLIDPTGSTLREWGSSSSLAVQNASRPTYHLRNCISLSPSSAYTLAYPYHLSAEAGNVIHVAT